MSEYFVILESPVILMYISNKMIQEKRILQSEWNSEEISRPRLDQGSRAVPPEACNLVVFAYDTAPNDAHISGTAFDHE